MPSSPTVSPPHLRTWGGRRLLPIRSACSKVGASAALKIPDRGNFSTCFFIALLRARRGLGSHRGVLLPLRVALLGQSDREAASPGTSARNSAGIVLSSIRRDGNKRPGPSWAPRSACGTGGTRGTKGLFAQQRAATAQCPVEMLSLQIQGMVSGREGSSVRASACLDQRPVE